MQAKDAVGRYGERVAERTLTEAGMTVLARNWRCELGEIDLVARDGRTLVVCEVKTRTSTRFGSPLEAVTREKAARLRRLAARFVSDSGLHPPQIRIDVIGIVLGGRGPAAVEHLRGAV